MGILPLLYGVSDNQQILHENRRPPWGHPSMDNGNVERGAERPACESCLSQGRSPWPTGVRLGVDAGAVPRTGSMHRLRTVRMRLWTVGRRPLRRETPVEHGHGSGQPERHADARYRAGESGSSTLCPLLQEHVDHLLLGLTIHRVTGRIYSARRHNCVAVRGCR